MKPTVAEKLMSRLEISEGCWTWRGTTNSKGYGRILVGKRRIAAHRISWMLHRSEIPENMQVLHRCDNPPCCNPDHLFLGTNIDNVIDRQSKGRWHGGYGENHAHSKLSYAQVAQIRELSVILTHTEIAKRFGVCRSHVGDIVNNRCWNRAAA